MKVSKLQELVPLYINGAMSDNDKRVFAQALKQNTVLKQEYMEFYELDSILSQSNTIEKQHLDFLFKNINTSNTVAKSAQKPVKPKASQDKLTESQKIDLTASQKLNLNQSQEINLNLSSSRELPKVERDFEAYDEDYQPEKFSKEYFLYLLSSPKIAWAIIGLQFVFLSFLVVLKFPHTLPAGTGTNDTMSMINVVFADHATQKDIRELLVDIKAQIANGPTDIGLYTIYVRSTKEQSEGIVDSLKKSKLILLAEPAFTGK